MEASHNADLVRISGVAYKATESLKAQIKKGYCNLNDKDYGAGMH